MTLATATEFEFRHRFWFITAIFCAAFGCYSFDHTNVAVAINRYLLGTDHDTGQVRLIFALGAAVIAAAALLRSRAAAYLHSSVVHDKALHSERLVADGPYRHVRNPLYIGTCLLAIGMGVMASRTGFLVLAVGMAVFTSRLINREELALRESQGESYIRYCVAVPRIVPSLQPRVPASGALPNWADGIGGEVAMWLIAASVAGYAATLKLSVFYTLLAAAFLARSVLSRRSRHRGGAASV